MQPWTPKLKETSEKLIDRIQAVAPELEVLFMGAAALGLPGKNDIDLDILCNISDITTYTEALLPILGVPKETSRALTAWEFQLDGFEIDVILSDPTISHVPLQQKCFEILKANPELLTKYRKLKEACNGLPYAEYERRKVAFFEDEVLSNNAKPGSNQTD